jgi:tRNA(Arg) A34 adenosine deaminase TadA
MAKETQNGEVRATGESSLRRGFADSRIQLSRRFFTGFVLYSTDEPCAMCAGVCVWSKIGTVVDGVSQEDITAYGKKHGTEEFK